VPTTNGNTAAEWVTTGSVTVRVPGKVNLFLAVGDRREDGYHELTTVFHAVSLADAVTLRTADLLSLQVVGEGAGEVPIDRRNLAWQAAELMAEHVGRAPDVEIPSTRPSLSPVAWPAAARTPRRFWSG
jgi:4-diphosphocytidyl-2-C-methyl-D-erythritol kinase